MDSVHPSNAGSHFDHQVGRSVSLEHAASALGVSRRTIYNWIRDGRLETIRTLGGSQRVLLQSLHGRSRSCANVVSAETARA